MNTVVQYLTETDILVVDDAPANIHLLDGLFRQRGVKVRTATSGQLALIAVAKKSPDLILLDARMPKMDGYEVCRQLKSRPATAAIPVIFISALDQTEDKVRAFQAGGVDYVTKPFHIEEVLARVETHLKINHLQLQLSAHNQKLEEQVSRRTQQLESANYKLSLLNKAKGDFLRLISHELRTPLNGLLGAIEMAFSEMKNVPGFADLNEIYSGSRIRLLALLDDAQLLTDIQMNRSGEIEKTTSMDAPLAEAAQQAGPGAWTIGVKVSSTPIGLGQVVGDPLLLKKALFSLIETAVKMARPETVVQIQGYPFAEEVCLVMEACGNTIPEDVVPRFFEVLAIPQKLTSGGDLGLTPAIAERIISMYGGRVQVKNLYPAGIQLQAWLPRQPLGQILPTKDMASSIPVHT
jgi:DNA-binding response OmpR family regulator